MNGAHSEPSFGPSENIKASDISCKDCHFSLTRSEWCCCRFDGSFLIELRLLLYLFLARKSCCARCLLPGACGVAFATYACGNSSTSPSDVSVMIHTHTHTTFHRWLHCTAHTQTTKHTWNNFKMLIALHVYFSLRTKYRNGSVWD